jgi:hypothetical protein
MSINAHTLRELVTCGVVPKTQSVALLPSCQELQLADQQQCPGAMHDVGCSRAAGKVVSLLLANS